MPALRAVATVASAPMSDRLQQLLRQRALLQEHLAWLDREIAEASGGHAAPAPSPTTRAAQQPLVVPTPPTPVTPTILPAPSARSVATGQAAQILAASAIALTEKSFSPAIEAAAEQIIEQYRGPDTTKTDIRKGCLLYFAAAFALLALVVTGLYFLFQRGK